MRILGIDPGSVICGYGIIEVEAGKIILVEYGVIKAKKKEEDFPLRLKEIFERLTSVIERHLPDESALESVFFSKNVQSLMKLSHARAAAMLASTLREIPVAEYSPREVKKAVTGNGNASKQQVEYMVKSLLKISDTHEFFDATDALAVALCHAYRWKQNASPVKNWKDYAARNPERIVKN
jgi:crossover junction endodeoxyribonuclease RuvC